MIYLIPILAFVLFVIDYRIMQVIWLTSVDGKKEQRAGMNIPWSGYGSIPDIISGVSLQPMQYRVFVPWLTRLFGGSVCAYMAIKYAGITAMLYGFWFYLGVIGINQTIGTLALCAFVPLTILYDYADAYWEMAFLSVGIGLILGGYSIWLISVIALLAALNRETVIIMPVLIVLSAIIAVTPIMEILLQFIVVSIALGAGLILPRMIYGSKKRYCPFNLIRTNLTEAKKELPNLMSGYAHFILIIGLLVYILAAAPAHAISELLSVAISVVAVMGLILIPGKWNEVRIFMPLALVMIPLGVGYA